LITIITPTYHTGHFLDSCISSVERSLGDLPYKHFIRDDGSHDLLGRTNSDKITLFQSPVNEGLGSNLLHLLQLVRTEWFIWLNADDLLLQESRDLVVRAFHSRESCGALIGDTIFADANLKPLRLLGSYPCSRQSIFGASVHASTASIIFRTRAVQDFSALKQFSHFADSALLCEVLRGGWSVENCPFPVSVMRRHENQLSIRVKKEAVRDERRRFFELFSVPNSKRDFLLRRLKIHHRFGKLRARSYFREFRYKLGLLLPSFFESRRVGFRGHFS